MNILVPIAGRDKYFPEGEYMFPKPLIDISGSPLIEHTVRSLQRIAPDSRFIFVVQDEDCRRFSLDNVLKVITHNPRTPVIRLKAPTQGAICSCLMAIDQIDPNEELIIANSDQVILADLAAIVAHFRARRLDSAVVTFDSTHPRFSYVRTDNAGRILETAEKEVISRSGIAGLYYFRSGKEFIDSAERVLLNDSPIQNAFFISQALNEMILMGKRLGHYPIPSRSYHPLYSQQKIAEYKEMLFADKNASAARRPVLVIPMAGEGERFSQAGYKRPKPFIDVAGKPMIQRVLDNLHSTHFNTVLVARSQHIAAEPDMIASLTSQPDRVRVVSVDRPTEGSACTILLARREIDRKAPLLIANCDQIVDVDCRKFVDDCLARKLDGSIMVFREPDRNPKWSYARVDVSGLVVETKEKVAISDLATVGLYFFTKGQYFIDAALDMIVNNDRVRNEFYTCPAFNYIIAQGYKVGVYEIPKTAMHGLGVPEDLEKYLNLLQANAVGTG